MTENNAGAKILKEKMTDPSVHNKVLDDCVILVDSEVSSKSGLSSLPVKGAYKLVKGIRPGFVRMVVEKLLPDFSDAIEDIWKSALSENDPEAYMIARDEDAAEALLKVTDSKIEHASSPVRGAYRKLRSSAKKHVKAAIPGLAGLLLKHAGP